MAYFFISSLVLCWIEIIKCWRRERLHKMIIASQSRLIDHLVVIGQNFVDDMSDDDPTRELFVDAYQDMRLKIMRAQITVGTRPGPRS